MRGTLVLAAACLISAATASAETITFDEVPTNLNGGPASAQSGSLTFTRRGSGLYIVNNDPPWGLPTSGIPFDCCDAQLVYEGSPHLASPGYADTAQGVDFARTDGSAFSLSSLELGEVWLPNAEFSQFHLAEFFGTRMDGSELMLEVQFDGVRDGLGGVNDFQAVSFSGWINLQSVRVVGKTVDGRSGDFSLDNITIGAAIPEPATWLFMIIGFAMIGSGLRASRSAPACAH